MLPGLDLYYTDPARYLTTARLGSTVDVTRVYLTVKSIRCARALLVFARFCAFGFAPTSLALYNVSYRQDKGSR